MSQKIELELDESEGPVQEFQGFVMVPRGLKVRLSERVPTERSATPGFPTPT